MTLPNIFAIQFILSVTRHFITLDTAISKSSCVTCWRRSRKANIPAWAPRYGATLKESWRVCMIKSWPVQVTEHDREWYSGYRYRMVWGSIWGVWKNLVIMIYSHTYVHLKSPTVNKCVSVMCNAWHFTTTTPSKRLSTNCLTLCTTRAVHTRGDLLQINATPLFSMEEAPKELQDSILEDLQKGSLFQFHLFVILEDCQSWCWYQLPEIWNLVYAYIV